MALFKDSFKCQFCGEMWGFLTDSLTSKAALSHQDWLGEQTVHMAGHIKEWSDGVLVLALEMVKKGEL